MSPIGRLNRRLTLEAPQRSPDEAGGWNVTWAPVATLWAEVRSSLGRERPWAEAMTAEATHRIRIRHRTGVGAEMRFTLAGRIFEIRSVIENGRRWLICLCQEKPLA